MSVLPVGIGPVTSTQYQIERSLRFNSADSAHLSRTPSVAGNTKTWTWSGWVKRSLLGITTNVLFDARDTDANPVHALTFTSLDVIVIYIRNASGVVIGFYETVATFRDISSWYHIVYKFDTTQTVAQNRAIIYVNGVQQTLTANTTILQNTDTSINTAGYQHCIGTEGVPSTYFNGYMTEINFIDGQALTPSSFGETDPNTGVWKPKKYTGTYGTNGFYLNFKDNSAATATTLGKDYSGNNNNWTPNAFTVIAGVNNDSMVDTPTPYGTDTGLGGQVRGNYCTLNPLKSSGVHSNGNLNFVGLSTSNVRSGFGTIGFQNTGKWYYEVNNGLTAGFTRRDLMDQVDLGTGRIVYHLALGNIYNEFTIIQSGLPTSTSTDTIGIALNLDSGTLTFYKNNTQLGNSVSIDNSLTWWPFIQTTSDVLQTVNFGQRPFAYQAPSGFKALCTTNLPTPTVVKGSSSFNTVTYTGNSSSQAITGVGHRPDLVWIKKRNTATVSNHRLFNSISGGSLALSTDTNSAESANTNAISFGNDGFTLGTGNTLFNESPNTYVAWTWKGGGTAVANTQGTITSTVSANTTAGFSIVTYTGNGANATIGHGLGSALKFIIVKRRNLAANWSVWHTGISNTEYLILNSTVAKATETTIWNSTSPTSTVFSTGTDATVNASGGTYIAYCFAEVPGFSAFGSYTGNGSTDGPFVYTGFRPKYLLIKAATVINDGPWMIYDTTRNSFNVSTNKLYANESNAENASIGGDTINTNNIDILSNGFKCRQSNYYTNGNSNIYIYAAFAETPFKYALAR
jgi:hypothetical protein